MKKITTYVSIVAVVFVAAFSVSTQTASASILETITTSPVVEQMSIFNGNFTSCKLTADKSQVEYGGGFTLSWQLKGFTSATINGEPVHGTSLTIDNVTSDGVYKLVATNDNGDTCTSTVTIKCLPPVTPAPKCDFLKANGKTGTVSVPWGTERVTLAWETTNADTVTLNGAAVEVDNANYSALINNTDTTFTILAQNGSKKVNCQVVVDVADEPTTPEECKMTLVKSVDKTTVPAGGDITYTVKIKNTGTGMCTGGGVRVHDYFDDNFVFVTYTTSNNASGGYNGIPAYSAAEHAATFNAHELEPGEEATFTISGTAKQPAACGEYVINNSAKATAYELNNFTTWVFSNEVSTKVTKDCPTPTPKCDFLTANGKSGTVLVPWGTNNVTLAWETTNAGTVTLNGNAVDADNVGYTAAINNVDTTFTILAKEGNKQASCVVIVDVDTKPNTPAPKCDQFTASRTSVPYNGADVTFTWETTDATNVSIAPTIGAVAEDGSVTRFVNQSATYVLTAKNTEGTETRCEVEITRDPAPNVFSCANNVTFTASDYSIEEGDDTILNWAVSEADTIAITDVTNPGMTGNQSVAPRNDKTYTLTATKDGQTISCPLSIEVDEDNGGGGGGGGSVTPRCELTISDKNITAGEAVTIKWDTRNATEVTLKDNHGKTIFTTDDYLSSDKKKYYDYEVTVRPTKDTTYTLVAERGSRERECEVKVNVGGGITVIEDRDQQPLVGGISLVEVPYTGFEAGTVVSVMFYLILAAWALYIAYVVVLRRAAVTSEVSAFSPNVALMKEAEARRPDLFPAVDNSQDFINDWLNGAGR